MSNPYVFKEPIQGKRGFHNRTSELTRLSSRMAAERPQSVSVVGGLRAGKTSLVNMLCDPESQADYLDDVNRHIILRLRLAYDTPNSPLDFFKRLDAALRYAGDVSMEPTYDGFSGVVKKLMQEGRKLVLCMDDFGEVTRNDGFPIDFFSFMRSIANSNDVGYLTTSSAPLQNLCHTQDIEESPFFNIFTTVNLEPFGEPDARKLVEDPAATAGSPFSGDEVDWLLELGGRTPYLLQLAAGIAFEVRHEGVLSRETVANRAFDEAEHFLKRLWDDHFSDSEREVLRLVGDGKGLERKNEHVADELERRGQLCANGSGGGYAFCEGLLERFVRQQSKGGLLKRLFG